MCQDLFLTFSYYKQLSTGQGLPWVIINLADQEMCNITSVWGLQFWMSWILELGSPGVWCHVLWLTGANAAQQSQISPPSCTLHNTGMYLPIYVTLYITAITNPMNQTPSEAKCCLASHKPSHILWDLRVHYQVQQPVTCLYPEPYESTPCPHILLTPFCRATRKLVIAIPCNVDGSRVSFSYVTSCTCICQLVWLTCHFKIINSFMQDAWGLKLQIDHDPPPIFRIIRLQQRDHSFRYSLRFPSFAIMALHRNVLQEDDILFELCADTRSDVSDYSDNESLDSDGDSDIPTTSSHKQLWSSTGPLTLQFPHPFSSHLSRQFL